MESRKKQNKTSNRRSEYFFPDPPRKKGFPSPAVFFTVPDSLTGKAFVLENERQLQVRLLFGALAIMPIERMVTKMIILQTTDFQEVLKVANELRMFGNTLKEALPILREKFPNIKKITSQNMKDLKQAFAKRSKDDKFLDGFFHC